MTHADYKAQGYEPRYEVTEVYEETDGTYCVDVFDNLKFGDKQIGHHTFGRLEQAEQFYRELTSEVDDWQVESESDDPQAEYETKAIKEVRGVA